MILDIYLCLAWLATAVALASLESRLASANETIDRLEAELERLKAGQEAGR